MNALLSSLKLETESPGATAASVFPKSTKFIESKSPIDRSLIGKVSICTDDQYENVIKESQETFLKWRNLPAPQRGEIVRQMGEAIRAKKKELGLLITTEMGKILSEGEGEVQEVIDIADFAVGLSRQLYGNTMHSERPSHRMYEQWHPLGIVGVITAFNFPMAVWAWNSFIAAVCGDVVLWKPSELTPLTAVALNNICREVAAKHGFPGLFSLVVGESDLGKKIAEDKRIPLVSATGSTRMGKAVGETVAKRLGRSLLELGGNNAVIVMDDADLKMATASIVFGSVGTAGQRCTTTRRVLAHKKIMPELTKSLVSAYAKIPAGDPRETGVLLGPVIHERTVDAYNQAIKSAIDQGGEVLCGNGIIDGMPSKLFLKPTIIKANSSMKIVHEETFAPILYLIEVSDLEEAIRINNEVPQGLSSSIFTTNLLRAEQFLSHSGSDCGIANVNIGTSGAEIGGAFGGEKETGGGREAGSDSWKAYMRRQTNTINYGTTLPLAQGVKFSID